MVDLVLREVDPGVFELVIRLGVPTRFAVFLVVAVSTKQLWRRDFSTGQEMVFSSFSLFLTRLFETGVFLC